MTTYASQNFDGVTAPTLPGGLTQDVGGTWITSTTHARTSPNGAVNNVTDAGAAHSLALSTIAGSADAVYSVDVYFTTATAIGYAFARAVTAASPLAACYATDIQVTGGVAPGLHISKDGFAGSLATLSGNVIASGQWYRISIQATGSSTTTIRVAVYRWGDGLWLQSGGTYSSSAAWALTATDSTTPFTAAGYGGSLCYQGDSGRVFFDNMVLQSSATNPPDPGPPTGTLIAADSANIHYSTDVVRKPGDGSAILMENGTSGRTTLATGATYAYAQFDVSALQAVTAASPVLFPTTSWPNIYWSLDGSDYVASKTQLQPPASGSTVYLPLGSGLSNSVPHRLQIWYEEISGQDTYNQTLYTIFQGLIIDSGGSISAPAAGIADPAGGTGMAFGNSILWGSQGLAVNANPFYQRFAEFLANGLNINLGVVGKPGQGLTHNADSAPIAAGPLGKDSWPNFDVIHVRALPSGLTYLFFAWGTNDGANNMTAQVTATTQQARADLIAAGSPNCRIVWLIPISGVHASEIIAGVAAAGDSKAKAVAWGGTFPDPANSSASSPDGTHPNTEYHRLIGIGYAQATQSAFSDSGGGGMLSLNLNLIL